MSESPPEIHESLRRRRIRKFSNWLVTPVFSVGSGLIHVVVCGKLPFLAALPLPWLIPILLFIFLAEVLVSIYLFRNSIPEVLIEILDGHIFSDKKLSWRKRVLIGLGFLTALAAGLSVGALTYMSAKNALGVMATLFHFSMPIGLSSAMLAFLSFFGAIAIFGLFAKHMVDAIRKNVHQEVFRFFKKFSSRAEHGKSTIQLMLENFFKMVLIVGGLLLALAGIIGALATTRHALSAFLLLIPHANILAVSISSSIIVYALMGIAKMPLFLKSVCVVFSKMGEVIGATIFRFGRAILNYVRSCLGMGLPAQEAETEETIKPDTSNTPVTLRSIVVSFLKVSAVCIHAFCTGALARSSGGVALSDLMREMHFPLSPGTIDAAGGLAAFAGNAGANFGLSARAVLEPPENPRLDGTEAPNVGGPDC